MLNRIKQYFEHLIIAAIKGFVVMAIAALVIVFGAFLLLAHRLPNSGIEVVLVVLVVGLSALLGAAIGLIWRFTHIPQITQAVGHLAHASDEQRK